MLAYYADLFVRALFAIPSSLGSNALGLIWPVIIVLCGEIIACLLHGWRTVTGKWKQASVVGFVALGVCYTVLFAWCALRENYLSHATLKTKVEVLQEKNDHAADHEKYAVLAAQSHCSEILGENRTLQHQNRDQQNTINQCQEKAIRLLVPPLQQTTAVFLDAIPDSGTKTVRLRYILLTNRYVQPVQFHVECGPGIVGVEGAAMGERVMRIEGGSAPQILGHSANLRFDGPAWTPRVPYLVTVYIPAIQSGGGLCSFESK